MNTLLIDALTQLLGERFTAIMQAIKHAIDPQNLMNPGKMLPALETAQT